MRSVQEVADELALLQHRYYVVERYLAGLHRLTVVAYREERNINPVFITFTAVEYMQMPASWQGAPFTLGTPDECRAFLESVGMDVVGGLPYLFYAQLPKSRVCIVCWGVETSEVMPP